PSHTLPAPHDGKPFTPDGMLVHAPLWPGSTHDWHWLEQALSQHTLAAQLPPWQSPAPMHALPTAQGVQLPPQSVSVSSPSFIMLEQAVPFLLVPSIETQSDVLLHLLPTPHGLQLPPQSVSVSSPFSTPSMQLMHTAGVWVVSHLLLMQSVPSPH